MRPDDLNFHQDFVIVAVVTMCMTAATETEALENAARILEQHVQDIELIGLKQERIAKDLNPMPLEIGMLITCAMLDGEFFKVHEIDDDGRVWFYQNNDTVERVFIKKSEISQVLNKKCQIIWSKK